MDKKKSGLSAFAVGAGKTAAGVLAKAKDKTVKIMDQNDDGKFNMADVSELAVSVGGAAKKTAVAIKQSADEKSRQKELRLLQPIFADEVDSTDFVLSKMIRICERDKRRAESEVCNGSVGYYTDSGDIKIVNIYSDQVAMFGIDLFPNNGYELYYVDPCDRDRYIALNDYFSEMKLARVNELQYLAQQLGAKHFRVTFKEEKGSISEQDLDANVSAKVVNSKSEHHLQQQDHSITEIAAEFRCDGHEPMMPELKYLQRDTSVQNLINLRMHAEAPIKSHKIIIKLSNSSGIKINDAIKLDSAIKSMKCMGTISLAKEAQNESRRYLDYEIDF